MKNEKQRNFSFALYLWGIELNCSLNCSSQRIDCGEISPEQKLQGWLTKSHIGGGRDIMPSECRSFNEILVVKISEKRNKH